MSDLNFVAAAVQSSNDKKSKPKQSKTQQNSHTNSKERVPNLKPRERDLQSAQGKQDNLLSLKKPSMPRDGTASDSESSQQVKGLASKAPLPLTINHNYDKCLISMEYRAQMIDTNNNWKVRTATIDDIHITIQQTIEQNSELIMHQSESLLEFFVSLLSDQNFKIVLMTLSIVNLVIGMPQHLYEDHSTSPLLQSPMILPGRVAGEDNADKPVAT